ncbi:hypothetical protein FK531_16815 [Rhodococcus spelaei]|uniref:Low molecular weight antigen MTB12-like C-terminal domain-containing protein n=1 Tax=Rhodococcus spelaei TaxID=2546320 RepID=A0A541B4H1_9NOCA|nr:hypothetical protein [Rhodococcus spelaei]TQF67215.1 hypothetical protein FK531_16815 [Rhodococcus spelaei]
MLESTRQHPTRRPTPVGAAAVLGFAAVLALVLGGCGSNDNTTSGTAPTSTTATGDAHAAVTNAFVAFFSGDTPGAEKITLVQNGQAFADTINAQAGSPMAKGTTATVSTVDLDAPGHATVTYTVLIDGKPVLPDQMGEAVDVDGSWKVAQTTFCALLTLEGNPPPVCAVPTTAAAPS